MIRRTRQSARRCGAASLLCLGMLVGMAGCVPDWSGLAPGGFWMYCNVEVWDCPKTVTPPDFVVSGSHASISKYITRDNFWKIKDAAYQVYWHPRICEYRSEIQSALNGNTDPSIRLRPSKMITAPLVSGP